jgi:hypothetical protein
MAPSSSLLDAALAASFTQQSNPTRQA